MKAEWENVHKSPQGEIWRFKIFGGWIVETMTIVKKSTGYQRISSNTLFVPDPNHEWKIDDEKA